MSRPRGPVPAPAHASECTDTQPPGGRRGAFWRWRYGCARAGYLSLLCFVEHIAGRYRSTHVAAAIFIMISPGRYCSTPYQLLSENCLAVMSGWCALCGADIRRVHLAVLRRGSGRWTSLLMSI
eukprot:3939993-Rhodomonas_salina.1